MIFLRLLQTFSGPKNNKNKGSRDAFAELGKNVHMFASLAIIAYTFCLFFSFSQF